MRDITPQFTIVASDAPARDIPTLDDLVTAGVRSDLGGLGTSSRFFMTDSNAQDLFNVTRAAVLNAETEHGRQLPKARAALAEVAADPWARISNE